MKERVAIILAAGISQRMKTRLPKVLHEVAGRPMLAYVLAACRQVQVTRIYVVVGFGADQVKTRFAEAEDIVWVEQKEQLGTAHAVLCCQEHVAGFEGDTLVLCGDGPLIRGETLRVLLEQHESTGSKAALATAVLHDPAGYGRIIRDADGRMLGIVEHRECTPEQLAIKEVNPSYYVFDNQALHEGLQHVKPNNTKQELYLTDVLAHLIETGHKVVAVTAVKPEEAMSVNSRDQLSIIGLMMQNRIQQELMDTGVTLVDPRTTWIDANVEIGQDTVIEPFTALQGSVKIGMDCRIGPFAYLKDIEVADGEVLGAFTQKVGVG